MLIGYVNDKIRALAGLRSAPLSAEVRLRHVAGSLHEHCACEVYLTLKDKKIFASHKGGSFEDSASQVVKRLLQRLRDNAAESGNSETASEKTNTE